MSKALEAHNLPLTDVFGNKYEFVIPRYQRPYAWTKDHALQLLEDLEAALTRNDDEPYFLGSLVLVQAEGPKADVIDGQQRLTTLTILLAALRDLTTNEALAAGIQEHIAHTAKAWKADAEVTLRLQVRAKDREFFRQYVQTAGSTVDLVRLTDNALTVNAKVSDSRRAIRDNAAVLRSRLETWDESKRTALFDFMEDRTELVVVTTKDETSAHRIFSVMNARGLPLSPTDIFKSDVVGSLPDHLEDEYADKWDGLENLLGRDDFTELFRDIRTIVNGKRAEKVLLFEFPRQVLRTYLDTGNAVGFIDECLRPYAEAFSRTAKRDYGPDDDWKSVNTWLTRLARFDNNDWRPIALWALTKHPDEPKVLQQFLRKLERVAAASMLRNEYTTPRVLRYLELLGQLKQGLWLDAPAFEITTVERSEARAALNGDVYGMRPARRKLILLRLDDKLANASGAVYDHKVISVEHVLPQSPAESSRWVKDFPDETEREYWTHRLGNLLLLNKQRNSAAGRKDFDVKKKSYFQARDGGTNFVLTSQVINEPVWTPDVVEKRQKKLVQMLVDEWELD